MAHNSGLLQPCLREDAPVSVADVVLAAQTMLLFYQRPTYMAWRTRRWQTDENLAVAVERARSNWRFERHKPYLLWSDREFDMILSQDVLLAALPDPSPQRLIVDLDRLTINAAESPEADIEFGLALAARPYLVSAITRVGLSWDEVRGLKQIPSAEVTELTLLRLGWAPEGLLDAAAEGTLPDVESLRFLVALQD